MIIFVLFSLFPKFSLQSYGLTTIHTNMVCDTTSSTDPSWGKPHRLFTRQAPTCLQPEQGGAVTALHKGVCQQGGHTGSRSEGVRRSLLKELGLRWVSLERGSQVCDVKTEGGATFGTQGVLVKYLYIMIKHIWISVSLALSYDYLFYTKFNN